MWVNAEHVREFDSLTHHITPLLTLTKGDICEFLAFPRLLNLMLDQTLINLIVCLMTSQMPHTKFAQKSSHVAVDTR